LLYHSWWLPVLMAVSASRLACFLFPPPSAFLLFRCEFESEKYTVL